MHNFGLGMGYLIGPILSFSFLLAWLILEVFALVSLRKQKLSTTAQAIWVLIILAIPIMGAIAFFILHPHENQEE